MDKTSLGFQKPKEEEYYDINIFNQNAQLANDLIEKNSSAIGQKLDKESSFYADLEAYYGNTKLIDDFQDISKWSPAQATISSDTTNVKIGQNSIKVLAPDTLATTRAIAKNNIGLDLSVLNNGESIGETDFINLVIFISDISKITTNSILIGFSQDNIWSATNSKYYQIPKNDLLTGWNFLKIKKTEFVTNGTGKWSDIKSAYVRWESVANAQNAYVSFQLIQLIKKDPLEDKPNPFQKFGAKDFTINSGEWFVGKEFGELCIKELGSDSPTNPKSLIGKHLFQDCNINYRVKRLGVNGVSWFGLLSEDNNKLIQVVILANKIYFRVLASSTPFETILEKSTDFTNSIGDILSFNIQRKGNLFKLIATNSTMGIQVESNLEYVLGKVCLCVGRSQGNTYLNNLYSASITEISHAHHADIAENAIELQKSVRELKGILEYTNLDIVFTPGLYHLNTTNTNMPISGNGFLEVTPHVKGSISYLLQDVTMWTANPYSMRRFQRVMLQGIWRAWDEFSWAKTPVETVITTNFSTGWSGQISTRKSADNWVEVTIHLLTKNVDISTTQDVLYTLPTDLRPMQSKVLLVNLFTNGTTPLNNSFANIILGADGRIILLPINGTTLTNARRLYGITFGYYV